MLVSPPRFTPFPSTTLFRSTRMPAVAAAHASRGCSRHMPGGIRREPTQHVHEPHLVHSGTDAAREHVDRKSTRLNSSHMSIYYAGFCLKKKRSRQLIPS